MRGRDAFVNPGGLGFRLDRLYAYLAVHAEHDESIVSAAIGPRLLPLVFGKPALARRLEPEARRVARATGVKVVLVRFERGDELQTFSPGRR